jgi:hypothetical protein
MMSLLGGVAMLAGAAAVLYPFIRRRAGSRAGTSGLPSRVAILVSAMLVGGIGLVLIGIADLVS